MIRSYLRKQESPEFLYKIYITLAFSTIIVNMILDSDNKKPNIEYPCNWDYKVIGTDVDEMISIIEQSVEGMDYKISSSNVSSKGNYFSLNLKVFVSSEVIRDLVFAKLKASEFIKMVL